MKSLLFSTATRAVIFADVRAAALTYVPRLDVLASITPKFFSSVASATTLRDYFLVVIA